jgi:hypothetical protein
MMMLVWFWATTAAAFMPSPMSFMTLPTQMLETQRTVVEAVTRPMMTPPTQHILTLGWVEEDEAPIF